MPKDLRRKESFRKSDRLYLRSRVQRLFDKGRSFKVFPFLVVYLVQKETNKEEETLLPRGVEMLISVAKHRFKKAVDRNRIKRLIRESFRRNESRKDLVDLLSTKPIHLSFAVIVLSPNLPTFEEVNKAMGKILNRLKKEVLKYNTFQAPQDDEGEEE